MITTMIMTTITTMTPSPSKTTHGVRKYELMPMMS